MDLWTRTWIFYNFFKWSTAGLRKVRDKNWHTPTLPQDPMASYIHFFSVISTSCFFSFSLFLFWKQKPNKLAQTCLASSLYKVLHPNSPEKELDRFILRSVWLSIQSTCPKVQCPVSREGLAYMTTLWERDIEWGSNDQPPGLWGPTWANTKLILLSLIFLWFPRSPTMLLPQCFCICCSLCLEGSSHNHWQGWLLHFLRSLLKWSGLPWLPYWKHQHLCHILCHYSALFVLE